MGPNLLSGSTSAKSLKNVLKISRKATEIIEKSTENQLKPKKTNGFQRESSKVDGNCAKSMKKCGICQNIIAESWGGTPPQMQYFDILQFFHTFFTLCVYFWSLFGLFLWNSLLCWGGKLDFSMISLAFLVIFQAFAATSKSHENPRFSKTFEIEDS